jgi:predicted dehydrogenase
MLIVTSRDPGAPPIPYIKSSGGIFKDMLIHDFDIFRWILDDDARPYTRAPRASSIRRSPRRAMPTRRR